MARPVFKRGLSINQTKPSMGREDTPKLTDLVEMYDWPKKGSFGTIRATGPVQGRGLHKVNVMKKDGSTTEITKVCLAYNVDTDEFDSDAHCPYCNMPEGYQTRKKRYFMNVIDRRIEEDAPANIKKTAEETKTGFKDVSSKSWTPVRVLGVPSTVATRLQQLSAKNVVKNKQGQKKQFDFNHDRFGFDLDISFDKSAAAANMYGCDRNQDERFTPLTEDQLDYLLFDLDVIYPAEDEETAKREAKSLTDRWRKATGDEGEVDDDEEETDRHQRSRGGKPSGKGGKPAPKGRGRQQQDEYDDDDGGGDDGEELDLDGEEEGGYEDPPPRRGGKKPAPKGRGRQQEEEEFGDDEGDGEDGDEYGEEGDGDEYSEDEGGDEYGEEGEEDGFEEEDAPPPPRRGSKPQGKPAQGKKPAARRAPPPEDEYGDDEGGEDGDDFEEDAPPPRRPAKPQGRPQGKPQGKPAQRGGKPAQGKRRPAPAGDDLDELDDDIPF